jgi:hypothetical protein
MVRMPLIRGRGAAKSVSAGDHRDRDREQQRGVSSSHADGAIVPA